MSNSLPNPEEDELVLLVQGLEFIETTACAGRGLDDASNAALKSIRKRARILLEVVRSISETTMFGPEELGRRMGSPSDEGDL